MTESEFDPRALSRVGYIDFTTATFPEAVSAIIDSREHRAQHFHLSNAYCVALAERDVDYRAVLREGTVFADGRPIQWVSHLRRDAHKISQVRGPTLFELALSEGSKHPNGVRHFLLGSSPETLMKLTSVISQKYANAIICGTWSPPFRALSPAEIQDQDDRISRSGADIVWVSLGTPKQDWECQRLTRSIGVSTVAIGAAFDFVAGTVRTAPEWMSRAGLEWFFRLCSEPRRLWRRYLFGNLVFLKAVVRSWRR